MGTRGSAYRRVPSPPGRQAFLNLEATLESGTYVNLTFRVQAVFRFRTVLLVLEQFGRPTRTGAVLQNLF